MQKSYVEWKAHDIVLHKRWEGAFESLAYEGYDEVWEEEKIESEVHWPFEVLEGVREVTYMLALPSSLSGLQ